MEPRALWLPAAHGPVMDLAAGVLQDDVGSAIAIDVADAVQHSRLVSCYWMSVSQNRIRDDPNRRPTFMV